MVNDQWSWSSVDSVLAQFFSRNIAYIQNKPSDEAHIHIWGNCSDIGEVQDTRIRKVLEQLLHLSGKGSTSPVYKERSNLNLRTMMEQYSRYKTNYAKNIMFDAAADNLSKR